MSVYESDVRCFCTLLLVLAAALAIAGIALGRAATKHERSHVVNIYDDHVLAWQHHRAQFEDAAFSFDVRAIDRDGAAAAGPAPAAAGYSSTIRLARNTSRELIPLHDSGQDLFKYQPLRYRVRGIYICMHTYTWHAYMAYACPPCSSDHLKPRGRYEGRGALVEGGVRAKWAEPILRIRLHAQVPSRGTAVCGSYELGGADGVPLAFHAEIGMAKQE